MTFFGDRAVIEENEKQVPRFIKGIRKSGRLSVARVTEERRSDMKEVWGPNLGF